MYPGREVYPNAPLEFVAAEIRFTYVPALSRPEMLDALATQLKDLVPLPKRERIQTVTFGAPSGPTAETEEQFRLLDRKSTTSVVIQPHRVVIETTAYPEFDNFREVIRRTVEALDSQHDIAGIERIGLRYIDEIRVPVEIKAVSDWRDWIDERLIAAATLRDDPSEATQGIVQFSTGAERHLTFRFGAINGPSVVGVGALKPRKEYNPGPYFLLDMDSYWEAPVETPPFTTAHVMNVVDELHRPTGEIFSTVLTERLKNEVLRKDRNDF